MDTLLVLVTTVNLSHILVNLRAVRTAGGIESKLIHILSAMSPSYTMCILYIEDPIRYLLGLLLGQLLKTTVHYFDCLLLAEIYQEYIPNLFFFSLS